MANITTVDELPKLSKNFSDEEVYERDDTPYDRIFLELFTISALLSVISNILLIFVILKYKKMREDTTNRIFLHVNILAAFYLFSTPLTLRVAMEFFDVFPVPLVVYCFSYQVETALMFGLTWFLFLLLCDWYIKLYHKETYMKFCRIYKFAIISLYVFIALTLSITLQFCFKHRMVMIAYLVMLGSVGIIIFILFVVNIMHFIKKRKIVINHRKGNIGLAIGNICFLCWTPALIYALISLGVFINYPILLIIFFVTGFSSPIFNIIYLYCYDDNYHSFLKQVITCKCNEYKNEDLDASVVYNDVEGVRISEN